MFFYNVSVFELICDVVLPDVFFAGFAAVFLFVFILLLIHLNLQPGEFYSFFVSELLHNAVQFPYKKIYELYKQIKKIKKFMDYCDATIRQFEPLTANYF